MQSNKLEQEVSQERLTTLPTRYYLTSPHCQLHNKPNLSRTVPLPPPLLGRMTLSPASKNKRHRRPVALSRCLTFLGCLPQIMNPINGSLLGASSLFPQGRDCQFQAAVVPVAGKCTGAVEMESGEVECETDCIFNLLHSLSR